MTSRRPMTRTYSGNGRTSSFSEEEGSSSNGRTESRNTYLSNVRPENRSTLCSVMSQLTEDIQPSFDTTLKSKAVSEKCNVKFICVVSGYPAPELTWYKDDTEMDRYCGLPKYEIRRNGKTHTLHIYNCTLDDAAIYQASASNSKGIVSCSGVLEVGIMNEYKIHQRFFAKLKQKAEKKRKELDESKTKGKENIQQKQPCCSPEHSRGKRSIPPTVENPDVQETQAVEQQGATALVPNGVSAKVRETDPVTSTDNDTEKVETGGDLPPKDTLAKKKMKFSNGVDAGVSRIGSNSRSHTLGNGSENSYDGGIGLAQFLAETLHSQPAEEKQNLGDVKQRLERPAEMNTSIAEAKTEGDRELEIKHEAMKNEREKKLAEAREWEKRREQELAIEREKERKRQPELHKMAVSKHTSDVKHHNKAQKEHDHHNIHTSISSVLHTVKDFFFGKAKKDSHDNMENEETEDSSPPEPQTPPTFHRQPEQKTELCQFITEEALPMELDWAKDSSETEVMEQQTASAELPEPPTENAGDSEEPSTEQDEGTAEAMEESVEEIINNIVEVVSVSGPPGYAKSEQKPPALLVSPEPEHQVTTSETNSSPVRDFLSLPHTHVLSEIRPSLTSSSNLGVCWTPPYSLDELATETLQKPCVDEKGKESDFGEENINSPKKTCKEEKTEVKSEVQPCPYINSTEVIELRSPLEERIVACETSNQVPDFLMCENITAAGSIESGHLNEMECTPLTQEMNTEFPVTLAPSSSANGDLKLQQECIPLVVESIDDNVNTKESLMSTSERRECGSVLKEGLIHVNSLDYPNIQEQTFLKVEGKEESLQKNKVVQTPTSEREFKMENEIWTRDSYTIGRLETHIQLEELGEFLNSHSEVSVSMSEDPIEKAISDSTKRLSQGLAANVPEIKIIYSVVEDIPDIRLTVPEIRLNEERILPEIKVMAPEIKECALPVTMLSLCREKSEPGVLQTHHTSVSEAGAGEHDSIVSPVKDSFTFTQTNVLNNDKLPLAEKTQEVVQPVDPVQRHEIEQQFKRTGEQLPQINYSSIPITKLSYTDDRKNGEEVCICLKSPVIDVTQLDKAPLVVPLITVICDSQEIKVSTEKECTETESLAALSREEKSYLQRNITAGSEETHTNTRDQKLQTKTKTTIEITPTPSLSYEALTPTGVTADELSLGKTAENVTAIETLQTKVQTEPRIESNFTGEDVQTDKPFGERLDIRSQTLPPLSPASLRRVLSKATPGSDPQAVEELSGRSTPTSSLSCESSPRLKRRDSMSIIRSATPEELASGARRKIFIPKAKGEDVEGGGFSAGALDTQGKKESPYMSPSQARRAALLQTPIGQCTPPMERRSPLLSRRKATLEAPKVVDDTASTKLEDKPAENEKEKLDPFKAPQVIRKIRGEPFPDASGHLKLWCQFFNVLSDSTIKWYRDEEEILEVKRSGGDESQVALAIVLASSQDCGVYACTINNDYGTDSTDYLLSVDILAEILLKEDLEVGEEIEMTPLLFTKGLADSGSWGEKFFGRIMSTVVHIGEGCAHKASRVKVIYGLDPIFDSGSTCIIKVQSPIAYGTKEESNLIEKNLEVTKQECKVQNMIREYCKIFAAEARVSETFGFSLEVISQYLMYRPANSVPYATVEMDLDGIFLKYCMMDTKGRLITRTTSEVEQKCCTFQHWLHQWTHGNLLVTQLEGVGTKLTNIRVVTKSKGYQGLTEKGSPKLFEQFLTHHQCNYYCGLLNLRPLKPMDSLQQPMKIKGSRSPLLNRKLGSSSPQLQRKGTNSPLLSRKTTSSPKVTRKAQETEENKTNVKLKSEETNELVQMR